MPRVFRCEANGHETAARRIFDCIIQKICQRLKNQISIASNLVGAGCIAPEGDRFLLRQGLIQFARVSNIFPEIDDLEVGLIGARLDAGNAEQ